MENKILVEFDKKKLINLCKKEKDRIFKTVLCPRCHKKAEQLIICHCIDNYKINYKEIKIKEQ